MPTNTPNFNLQAPQTTDNIVTTIQNLASNFNSIDNILENHASSLADMVKDICTLGAKGDGSNETATIQNILNNISDNTTLLFPQFKNFLVDSLTLTKKNVTIILNNCILEATSFNIQGDGSGIICTPNAIINGRLKYSAVSVQANTGATQITVSPNHGFVVGDGVQSSYGLGSDGSNPIAITAVNGNTITVATPTTANIPVGAYIGTFGWGGTIGLVGNNTFLKGANIINAQGYSVVVNNINNPRITGVLVQDCTFDKNGLDEMYVGNADCEIRNANFKYNIDCAKQGLVIVEAKVKLINCNFNRLNSDVDIYIMGNNSTTELTIEGGSFEASGNNHPSPFNTNSWAAIQLACNTGSLVNKIIVKGATFSNYGQGLLSVTNSNTAAITVNYIRFLNCMLYNTELGRLTNVTVNDYQLDECTFDGQSVKTSSSNWVLDNTHPITLKNCTIKNDNTFKVLHNIRMIGCEFTNCNSLFQDNTSYLDIRLNSTSIGVYPYWDNTAQHGSIEKLVINNPTFTTDSNSDNHVILKRNHSVVPFVFLNGTLKGLIYYQNYHSYYLLNFKICNGDKPQGLFGDDWRIPLNSLVEDILQTSANRFKVVMKSNIMTTTATAASGATSITVNNIGSTAVNDIINIVTSDGRVHTSQVTSISGINITFADALINNVLSGANVCTYLYS